MEEKEVEFIKNHREIVVEKWLSDENVIEIFNSKDINYIYFQNNYLDLILDYILDIAVDKKKIIKSLQYITDKGVSIDELIDMFVLLHKIVLDLAIFSMDELDCKVIKCFEFTLTDKMSSFYKEYIATYNQKKSVSVSYLLESYKNAIDESTIVSKTDTKGIITYANKKFCKLSKYSEEELIGKPHSIVRDASMPKAAFEELWNTIQSKKIWKGIVKNRAKDGSVYIVDATIVPILDKHDEIVEYIGIRHDITEIEQMKEQMLENKTKILSDYKKAVDASSIVSTTDTKGFITYVNDTFCRISGYDKEELMGKSQNIVRHPDMPKEAFKELWQTIQSGEIWQGVVKNLKKDGGFYIVDATIVPIQDSSGKIIEYIGIRKDITEQEMQKQELEAMRIKQMHKSVDKAVTISYEKMIELMPLPIVVINKEDYIIACNSEAQELFDNTDILQKPLKEMLEVNAAFDDNWKEGLDLFDEDVIARIKNKIYEEKKLLIKQLDESHNYLITLI